LNITFFLDLSITKFNHEDAIMSQNKRHPFKAMALISVILSQLVGPILIGIFFGKWLDSTFNTEPLLLVVGLLIGLATGIIAMLSTVRQYF
jgi:ATP synthase protein I